MSALSFLNIRLFPGFLLCQQINHDDVSPNFGVGVTSVLMNMATTTANFILYINTVYSSGGVVSPVSMAEQHSSRQ